MGSDLLDALRTRPGQENAGRELPEGGGWLYCEVGADTQEATFEAARALPGLVEETVVDSVVVGDPAEADWERLQEIVADIERRVDALWAEIQGRFAA